MSNTKPKASIWRDMRTAVVASVAVSAFAVAGYSVGAARYDEAQERATEIDACMASLSETDADNERAWGEAAQCSEELEAVRKVHAETLTAKDDIHHAHGRLMWTLLKEKCESEPIASPVILPCQGQAMLEHNRALRADDFRFVQASVLLSKATWGWLRCECPAGDEGCQRQVESSLYSKEQRP